MAVKEQIVSRLNAGVVFICESWERKDRAPNVPGHTWLRNRQEYSNKKQYHGFGGIGFFVRDDIMTKFKVQIVDKKSE